mgnify:CR=1 FL=1
MDDCASSHSNTVADCTPLVQERVAIGGHGVQPLPTMTKTSNGVFARVSMITISILPLSTILVK